jgi:uncharacterized protein (TIGR02466 family)
MSSKNFFSTVVEQTALKLPKRIHDEIKRTSLKLREIDDEGVKWCKKNYMNGYTSYGSMSQLHQQFSVFDDLKRLLDREVARYAKKVGMKFDTGALELSSIWVNVMSANCYHAFHAHPLSVVSGTFYVSVGKGSSPLRIEDPRAGLFMAAPHRKMQIDLQPKDGDVILFESWLKHEVPPHQNTQERVSVSFNYDWFNR